MKRIPDQNDDFDFFGPDDEEVTSQPPATNTSDDLDFDFDDYLNMDNSKATKPEPDFPPIPPPPGVLRLEESEVDWVIAGRTVALGDRIIDLNPGQSVTIKFLKQRFPREEFNVSHDASETFMAVLWFVKPLDDAQLFIYKPLEDAWRSAKSLSLSEERLSNIPIEYQRWALQVEGSGAQKLKFLYDELKEMAREKIERQKAQRSVC